MSTRAVSVVGWVVVVVAVALPGRAHAQCPCETQPSGFAGGDGTPGNPYQVCLPEHLDNVRNHLSASFIQTADIDMGGFGNFTPIGDIFDPFDGSYDGSFLEISNLTTSHPSSNDIGLIGVVSATGSIKKVRLANVLSEGSASAGGLAGQNFGTISECMVDGVVNGFSSNAGGLIGTNIGIVSLSRSLGSVTGFIIVGGLVGELAVGAAIDNSYSQASVSALEGGNALGGLVGIVRESTAVDNSYSTGLVQSIGAFFGGLIGVNQGATITASFWDINTSGQGSSAGGVGKTTAEMQMQVTFDPPWDFVNVWEIDEGNDYPRLREPELSCTIDCQCDDGEFCNGDETCDTGSCIAGTPADDGTPCGDGNECHGGVCLPPDIPTVSEWGLIVMTLLLLTSGTLVVRHRRSVAA